MYQHTSYHLPSRRTFTRMPLLLEPSCESSVSARRWRYLRLSDVASNLAVTCPLSMCECRRVASNSLHAWWDAGIHVARYVSTLRSSYDLSRVSHAWSYGDTANLMGEGRHAGLNTDYTCCQVVQCDNPHRSDEFNTTLSRHAGAVALEMTGRCEYD
ncbi:hypothetical protein PHLGIDRAFT_212252 [Phlebiopsis gigantea 11061_1 CR5-6]|uniref:Uncharacterized protein n=1 Tax=Phlebiopsis gigantea (strain 11061_1 CR5-6) TaxID=745531 RepID=A0A0C3PEX5_PHLG1|nr:hypothetical protein PHLGIDRAFT_212252 [Phlebiopsis gigantea 11061_1 CR5-6]